MLRLPAWSEWMTSPHARHISQALGRRAPLLDRQVGQCEDVARSPQRSAAMPRFDSAPAINDSARSKAQKPWMRSFQRDP
jgi:hypothetical protein